MRDRVTKAMDTKIKSNNKNITYGVWMAITGVLIGVVCDECPISLPVIIGQLGGLAIVLCGVLLMADGLMAVIWADKGGGKAYVAILAYDVLYLLCLWLWGLRNYTGREVL